MRCAYCVLGCALILERAGSLPVHKLVIQHQNEDTITTRNRAISGADTHLPSTKATHKGLSKTSSQKPCLSTPNFSPSTSPTASPPSSPRGKERCFTIGDGKKTTLQVVAESEEIKQRWLNKLRQVVNDVAATSKGFSLLIPSLSLSLSFSPILFLFK